MNFLKFRLLAASTIVVAAPAFAQRPAAPAPAATSCEIDQARPQGIARAMLSLTKAQTAMNGGDPTKDLKDIVAILTAANYKNENPIGRAFMLASAYVFLLEQPGFQAVMPRGSVGIAVNPTATIDLFAAADSAITVVENSSADCVTYMAPFRQQKAWLTVTNSAINALNANQLDSAEIFARRSLTLDRKSPYPYTVLASVAKAKGRVPEMIEYSKQVISTAGSDTSYADVRERAMYEIAVAQSDRVQKAAAAEKKALAKEAVASWSPLVASEDAIQGTNAVRQLNLMYIAAGDSLQLGKIYAPMIVDATKYSEGALLQAGVIASQIKRPDDAALLFEGVVARNPYSRDGLNNLAASYLQAGESDKANPIIGKLVALDPNNPDNWLLYAFSYVGRLKNKNTPAQTRLYNDSLVFYNTKAEKMPMRVAFSEFSRNSEGTTVVGTVENRGSASRSYTLNFEFLGPKGEVLFTETATVGPVAARATKEFRIKNEKTGVAGYRYKPIS